MENDIVFLALDKKFSEKKSKDYFELTCLLDSKNCRVFIDENVYKKLLTKDLKYLQKYKAVFRAFNRFGSLSIELIDIK